MQEITAPFAAVKEEPASDPGEPDFPLALRGYDRLAVDAYITQCRQLISDLRSISSPEAAVQRGTRNSFPADFTLPVGRGLGRW